MQEKLKPQILAEELVPILTSFYRISSTCFFRLRHRVSRYCITKFTQICIPIQSKGESFSSVAINICKFLTVDLFVDRCFDNITPHCMISQKIPSVISIFL